MTPMPPLKPEEHAKLKHLLAQGELLPVLNNTKWSELIQSMISAPAMVPQFRVHSVFAPAEYVTDWDSEWHYHIHPVSELEWIELKAISEEWLKAVLRRHNIPWSVESGLIRVWGYTRSGHQPNWVA